MLNIPSFKATKKERALVGQVVERAAEILKIRDCVSLSMDITACHANGCPLDLKKLRAAPDFDFVHDVVGIMHHIDRRDGKLVNFFLPRCSKPESEVAK